MNVDQMRSLFFLSGIEVKLYDELPNQYWPRAPEYQEVRERDPWWLVHTEYGMIVIGWRKRVISIDWERTPVRCVVTNDDVTRDEAGVHAWSYAKAVEYLTEWKRQAEKTVAESKQ